MSYNKAILIGRLTADPDLKITPQGINVCAFTIAVDRLGKDKKADFIRVEAWRCAAEFVAKFFSKGKAIGIEGHIQVDTYDKDGEKRTAYKVVADRAFFVGDKAENGNESLAQQPKPQINEAAYDSDADLPF